MEKEIQLSCSYHDNNSLLKRWILDKKTTIVQNRHSYEVMSVNKRAFLCKDKRGSHSEYQVTLKINENNGKLISKLFARLRIRAFIKLCTAKSNVVGFLPTVHFDPL